MCGRFTLSKEEDFIEYRFSKKSAAKLNPNYNVAPGSNIATISQFNSEKISLMKWGWSNSLNSPSGLIINARTESVLEKYIYKSAINNHRCLIIADGYIEWKTTKMGKKPYLIKFESNQLFTFAGIAREISDSSGKNIHECLILTTNANDSVCHIHHRMPLILNKEIEDAWINEKIDNQEFEKIFTSNSKHQLISYVIDKKINKVSNNYPELLNQSNDYLTLFD